MIYDVYQPEKETTIDDQIALSHLCQLLDNQWELEPEIRKQIWKLYSLHINLKSLLLTQNHGKSNRNNQKYEWN